MVGNRGALSGWVVLVVGLLLRSLSSFLEHQAILGTATDTAGGFLDGLAVVAFAVAIFVLLRARRRAQQ